MVKEAPAAGTPCRLVTFLGTGKWNREKNQFEYETVPYSYRGSDAVETPWVVQALCGLMQPRPTEIRVLRTEGAKKAVGDRFERDMQAWGKVPFSFVDDFPEGGDERALWQQFEIIKQELRAPRGHSVILDITHGFRSFPFFGGAVAAFVRAIDAEPCPLRIVYGAFEARRANAGVAPIWELTPFVDLLDWTREIMLFLKTGRAAGVGERLKKVPELAELGAAVHRFGGDLETMRTGSLLLGSETEESSARALAKQIDACRQWVHGELPPFSDVLHRLEEKVQQVNLDRQPLNSDVAQKALADLARWYVDMGRYVEATTMAQEGWISLYAEGDAAVPGSAGCTSDARKAASNRWFTADKRKHAKASDIRNDIDHAGYRPKPAPAEKVMSNVSSLVADFAKAQTRASPAAGCPAVFVNLTNHPSAEWEDAQRQAALALAPGLVDVAFPAVPPAADEEAITALAKETGAAVPQGATHALVQGEWTLTVALLPLLQRRGIVCLAATTARDVNVADDGAKTSRFRFVRFRRYADA